MSTQKIFKFAVPVALLALSLFTGSILILRFFFLSALVMVLSYLWTKFSLRNLSARLAPPPEHLQVGDMFQREVIISNPGRFSRLWLRINDNTELSGHHNMIVASIAGRGSHIWHTEFFCRKRGRYQLGQIRITTSDPFGIFDSQCTMGQTQEITVYPATIDLPLFRFVSFSYFGDSHGYRSMNRVSSNASSVREFVSGDSLHYIHWRSTARTGKLMVKMFDADRSYNASKTAWVLLDMNEEAHFGRGEDASDEYGITITASVVKKYLQGGMQVGMLASDESRYFSLPERGEAQLWQILERLATMKTDWRTKLSDSISQHLDSFRDNPLVIIVCTSATENLMETIHQLRNRVDSVVVVLLEADSFGGRPVSREMSRTLAWMGVQVYPVKKGDELAIVLDSKVTQRHALQM